MLFGGFFINRGYEEVILPSICEQEIFTEKAGPEILNQMWSFKDKGDRNVCLIPEVTAVIQRIYNDVWEKSRPKPLRLFYVNRCYRYDRPQMGRYREFTQLGVEYLGGDGKEEVVKLLTDCLDLFKLDYKFVPLVKRGLSYYLEEGFEVECEKLGAQKQIAGGGRYKEGIGWAIGIDRLVLALQN